MADKALDILVRLRSELQGAQDADSALKAVSNAAKQLEGNTKELSKAESAAGETTGKLTLKKNELKKIVNELSREFPILGSAAKFAMEPQVAIVLAAVTAFALLKRKYNEAEEALKGGDWKTITGFLNDQNTAASSAASSLSQYEESLRLIAEAQQTIKEKTDAALASMRAQAAFEKELREARAALERERIEADKKSGKIGPVAAAQRLAAVQKQSIQEEAEATLKAAEEELKLQEEAKKKLQEEMKQATSRIEEAQNTKAQIEKKIENAPKQISRDKAALGVNEEGFAIDKKGNVITKDENGKLSGKRTGELGKLDYLQEEFDVIQAGKTEYLKRFKDPAVKAKAEEEFNSGVNGARLRQAGAALEQQKLFVESVKKLIATEDNRLIRLKNDLARVTAQLDSEQSRDKGNEQELKNITEKTIPSLQEQIALSKRKISEVVPTQKKAIDIHTDTEVQEIKRQELEREQREGRSGNRTGSTGGSSDHSAEISSAAKAIVRSDSEKSQATLGFARTVETALDRQRTEFMQGLRQLEQRINNSRVL